jgi:hypothetical protein
MGAESWARKPERGQRQAWSACGPATDRRSTTRDRAFALGLVGLVWTGATSFDDYFRGAASQPPNSGFFPGVDNIILAAAGWGMLGFAALLIGTVLTYLRHAHGRKTVRTVCWSMLVVTTLFHLATLITETQAAVWPSLDSAVRGRLLGMPGLHQANDRGRCF